MSKPKKIVGDSLVRDLQENGKVPENMSVLSGFIGDGETEETIHFYTDVSLRNYLIIPVDDILHQVKLTTKFSPVGGSMIWVQHPETFDSKEVLEKQAKYAHDELQAQSAGLDEGHAGTGLFSGDVYNQYTTAHQDPNANMQTGAQQIQTQVCAEGFTHNCIQTQVPICLPDGTA